MIDQKNVVELLTAGKVEGFISIPRKIETIISYVFIFENEKKVLKLYKRDNEFFNSDTQDISQGKSRREFIETDFAINQAFNSEIYLDIQQIRVEEDRISFHDIEQGTDEMIIVMEMFNPENTFTNILFGNSLTEEDYFDIGARFAEKRVAMKGLFIGDSEKNLYELMRDRVSDIEAWPKFVPDFDSQVSEQGFKKLSQDLAKYKEELSKIDFKSLYVTTDCLSENSYYENSELHFFDVCSPKKGWRLGSLEFDIMRVGTDIYALAGKENFGAYMRGIMSVVGDQWDQRFNRMYLLFSAFVMNMYLYARSEQESRYKEVADRYSLFTKELVENYSDLMKY